MVTVDRQSPVAIAASSMAVSAVAEETTSYEHEGADLFRGCGRVLIDRTADTGFDSWSTNSISCRVCHAQRDWCAVACKRSPVEGVWTVHGCETCLYAWRDTEPEENRNPDLYPEPFRLKAEDVESFLVVPTIPRLREQKSDG